MEITIQIDENLFHNVVEKEIEALPKEKMADIIANGITEFMKQSDYMKQLLFKETGSNYGYNGHKDLEPTQFLVEAGKMMDISPAIKELQEKSLEYIKQNFDTLLIRGIASWMSSAAFGPVFQMQTRELLEDMLGKNNC